MKVVDVKSLRSETWHENPNDPEIKVKIRRFPLSASLFAPNDPDGFIKLAWQRFNYCIIDWKGFTDTEDKPLECNDENKRAVFDFFEDILVWVSSLIMDQDIINIKKKVTT